MGSMESSFFSQVSKQWAHLSVELTHSHFKCECEVFPFWVNKIVSVEYELVVSSEVCSHLKWGPVGAAGQWRRTVGYINCLLLTWSEKELVKACDSGSLLTHDSAVNEWDMSSFSKSCSPSGQEVCFLMHLKPTTYITLMTINILFGRLCYVW